MIGLEGPATGHDVVELGVRLNALAQGGKDSSLVVCAELLDYGSVLAGNPGANQVVNRTSSPVPPPCMKGTS